MMSGWISITGGYERITLPALTLILRTAQSHSKTYYFLSQQPKFEVKFPPDGSKPPTKHPNSIQRQSAPRVLEDTFNENEDSNTFVRALSQKERPSGREQSDVSRFVVKILSRYC